MPHQALNPNQAIAISVTGSGTDADCQMPIIVYTGQDLTSEENDELMIKGGPGKVFGSRSQ